MSTALVTGASRGLGAAFARRLAADGYDLVVVGRDAGRLEELASGLRTGGQRVETLVADLATADGLERVERRVGDPDRPVDLLVHGAGPPSGGPVVSMSPAELDEQVALTVTSVQRISRAALVPMVERGHGRIVVVASFAGYFPMPGSSYGPAKAWQVAFTDSVAAGLAGTGVRIIALVAGRVVTGRNAAVPRSTSRTGTWLDPDHVVAVCLADLERGRTRSVPGLPYRAAVEIVELPRGALRAGARLGRRARGLLLRS